jgi:hypothetical protein
MKLSLSIFLLSLPFATPLNYTHFEKVTCVFFSLEVLIKSHIGMEIAHVSNQHEYAFSKDTFPIRSDAIMKLLSCRSQTRITRLKVHSIPASVSCAHCSSILVLSQPVPFLPIISVSILPMLVQVVS